MKKTQKNIDKTNSNEGKRKGTKGQKQKDEKAKGNEQNHWRAVVKMSRQKPVPSEKRNNNESSASTKKASEKRGFQANTKREKEAHVRIRRYVASRMGLQMVARNAIQMSTKVVTKLGWKNALTRDKTSSEKKNIDVPWI